MVTDVGEAMDLLEVNIRANEEKFKSGSGVAARRLRWGSEEDHAAIVPACREFFSAAEGAEPFDLILAADCVYWESLHSPLSSCLHYLLTAAPSSVCVIAGMRRWKRDTGFYAGLNKKGTGMRCRCVSETVEVVEDVNDVMDEGGGGGGGGGRGEGEGEEERGRGEGGTRREIMRMYAVSLS